MTSRSSIAALALLAILGTLVPAAQAAGRPGTTVGAGRAVRGPVLRLPGRPIGLRPAASTTPLAAATRTTTTTAPAAEHGARRAAVARRLARFPLRFVVAVGGSFAVPFALAHGLSAIHLPGPALASALASLALPWIAGVGTVVHAIVLKVKLAKLDRAR